MLILENKKFQEKSDSFGAVIEVGAPVEQGCSNDPMRG